MAPGKRPAEERFWAKVDKTGECWIWIAGKSQQGYGVFGDGKRTVGAHRFSWELHNGPIPDGHLVCHHCDTPACVRPDHLFLGNSGANTRDMIDKERHSWGTIHSGKLNLRMPVDLHAHLVDRAAEQGVSLNQLIVALLAGGSHFEQLRTGGS